MRALSSVVLLASSAIADPVLVDRVIASVDGQPVFRSELERRLAPQKHASPEARRLAREALIDARLIAKDVGSAPTEEEVDQAFDAVAKNAGLDRAGLEAEAKRQGLLLPDYREELRAQLSELRWLMLRSKGTTPATPEARATLRAKLLADLRKRAVIEVFE